MTNSPNQDPSSLDKVRGSPDPSSIWIRKTEDDQKTCLPEAACRRRGAHSGHRSSCPGRLPGCYISGGHSFVRKTLDSQRALGTQQDVCVCNIWYIGNMECSGAHVRDVGKTVCPTPQAKIGLKQPARTNFSMEISVWYQGDSGYKNPKIGFHLRLGNIEWCRGFGLSGQIS